MYIDIYVHTYMNTQFYIYIYEYANIFKYIQTYTKHLSPSPHRSHAGALYSCVNGHVPVSDLMFMYMDL